MMKLRDATDAHMVNRVSLKNFSGGSIGTSDVAITLSGRLSHSPLSGRTNRATRGVVIF